MIASARLEEIAEEISKIIANYPIKYELINLYKNLNLIYHFYLMIYYNVLTYKIFQINQIIIIFDIFTIKYEKFLKIYLTGRGIADMKGVRSVMANALGRQCELIRAMYEDRNKIYLSQYI